MGVNDISLTSGMRSNLLQLQSTSKLIDRTQERLSTGKQVNSALDNPTNFFAAQAHMNRASDFSIRKDGMAEAVQQVKAGDAGITAISSLLQAAKGLAESATSTAVTADRKVLMTQFNTLMSQIDQLSSDSGYRGTNLLNQGTVTVNFNEDASANLKVTGFNATAIGLSVSQTGTANTNWTNTAAISTSSAMLDTAISQLRTQSKSLSNNLNIITTRQEFTDQMIGTLQTGADNLTLADMNQEGANMLMLQTQQNLGTTALSMSSQAAQSVLRLF
ncbi:MAG: flagellin [Trichlorobacter sp.]|uniref:flagellin N-terminal helical domain-containing protein n=1 Tax=Trichlorobacter sp. TaxID=2911007 RepID=UPI002560BDC9|nr:flagellin [Trichlorobacter sp.]MDK9719191.1 flagellin [Trichlorobacter sp.]